MVNAKTNKNFGSSANSDHSIDYKVDRGSQYVGYVGGSNNIVEFYIENKA